MIHEYFTRSDENPYFSSGEPDPLRQIFRPVPDSRTDSWRNQHEGENPYTHPNVVIEMPGGVAIGAYLAITILHWLIEHNIRVPLLVGRSAPAMPLAMLQQGFSLQQIFDLISWFDTKWILQNPRNALRDFPHRLTFIDQEKIFRHFSRMQLEADSAWINRRRNDTDTFVSPGFNIGFIATSAEDGSIKLISSGRTAKAALATSGLWPLIPGAKLQNQLLLDGEFSPHAPLEDYRTVLGIENPIILKFSRSPELRSGTTAKLKKLNQVLRRWPESGDTIKYSEYTYTLDYMFQSSANFKPFQYDKPDAAIRFMEAAYAELENSDLLEQLDASQES